MKRIVAAVLVALTLLLVVTSPVFAGGDQVRGDKAAGPANQYQEMNPSPFQ